MAAQASARLEEIEILAVDCQATAAASAGGRLLELGWCRVRPGVPLEECCVRSRVIAQPHGAAIPRRVRELTGIDEAALRSAVPAREAWAELLADVRPDGAPALAVAHYARFELPFLAEVGGAPGEAFPLELLCTHEIARRLWPNLPRRGIRAVAGMLGHVLPEQRRAAEHARATALIWREMIGVLREKDVASLAQLRALLAALPPERGSARQWPLAPAARLKAPQAPGVYRLRAKGGALLYVGKATSLKRRVNSYFQKRHRGEDRALELLTQVGSIEWTQTATELEAALLESDEIKALAPRYNQALTGRDAGAWFATRDLTGSSATPDERHPWGPLPRRDSAAAIPAIAALLSSHTSAGGELLRRALQLPDLSRIPPPDAIGHGLAILRARWGLGGGEVRMPELLRVAVCAWWRDRADRADREEPEPGEERAREGRRWWEEPAYVAERLEFALSSSAHLLRRARWSCELATSSVAWPLLGTASRRWLRFEAGALAARGDLDGAEPLPGCGAPRPRSEVQGALDFAAYERLRVLTTGLRGLVKRGLAVEVALADGRRLDSARLSRRLFWI